MEDFATRLVGVWLAFGWRLVHVWLNFGTQKKASHTHVQNAQTIF